MRVGALRTFVATRVSKNPTHKGLLQLYSEQLDKHPIVTKSLNSGVIAFFGDFIAQKSQGTELDLKRLLAHCGPFPSGLTWSNPAPR